MPQTHQELIRETVAGLLQKLGFEASIEVTAEDDLPHTFFCKMHVEQDQNFLIGQYGVNLAAVQHLIRAMLRKKSEERLNVIIDVNDYYFEKKVLLEKEAERAAEEALKNNISVALRPMLSYERKIVHSFFSENPKITTESVGSGEERKIMVSPKLTENDPVTEQTQIV